MFYFFNIVLLFKLFFVKNFFRCYEWLPEHSAYPVLRKSVLGLFQFWTVVSHHHMGAGNQTYVWKSSSCCWAVSCFVLSFWDKVTLWWHRVHYSSGWSWTHNTHFSSPLKVLGLKTWAHHTCLALCRNFYTDASLCWDINIEEHNFYVDID